MDLHAVSFEMIGSGPRGPLHFEELFHLLLRHRRAGVLDAKEKMGVVGCAANRDPAVVAASRQRVLDQEGNEPSALQKVALPAWKIGSDIEPDENAVPRFFVALRRIARRRVVRRLVEHAGQRPVSFFLNFAKHIQDHAVGSVGCGSVFDSWRYCWRERMTSAISLPWRCRGLDLRPHPFRKLLLEHAEVQKQAVKKVIELVDDGTGDLAEVGHARLTGQLVAEGQIVASREVQRVRIGTMGEQGVDHEDAIGCGFLGDGHEQSAAFSLRIDELAQENPVLRQCLIR